MKILSANLGMVQCHKNLAYVPDLITVKNSIVKYTLSASEISVQKSTISIVSMAIMFRDMDDKNVIGEFKAFAVVGLELDPSEIQANQNIVPEIQYFAFTQAWPLFESQSKVLRDLKYDIESFPSLPPKDEVLTMLLENKK